MPIFHMEKQVWYILYLHRGPKLCNTHIENCDRRFSQPPSQKAFPRKGFFAQKS